MEITAMKSWNLKQKVSIENRDTARHLAGQNNLNKNMIMPGASSSSLPVSGKEAKNK